MFSTKLLDFDDAREALEIRLLKPKKAKEYGTEMQPLDPMNSTVTKISRLQKYKNLVNAECNKSEADTDEKKKALKEKFIEIFDKLQKEHQHIIMQNPGKVTGCKRELFHLVDTLLNIFQSSPTSFEDYVFVFDVVRFSDVLKTHVTELNKFWSMPHTQTQIDLLNKIRDIAYDTLGFSIQRENEQGYRSKDKRILSSLERAMKMPLFVLELGNGLVKTSKESEVRALLLEQQKKHGMHTPVSIMTGY